MGCAGMGIETPLPSSHFDLFKALGQISLLLAHVYEPRRLSALQHEEPSAGEGSWVGGGFGDWTVDGKQLISAANREHIYEL